MDQKLSYEQIRYCVIKVYDKRGYHGAQDFLLVLQDNTLLSIMERVKLQSVLTTMEMSSNKMSKNIKSKVMKELKKLNKGELL